MASFFNAFPLLRHAAPRRAPDVCSRFLRLSNCAITPLAGRVPRQSIAHSWKQYIEHKPTTKSTKALQAKLRNLVKPFSTRQTPSKSEFVPVGSKPLDSLKSTQQDDPKHDEDAPRKIPHYSRSYFPRVSDKSVAYWLLGSAVSVFGIVVFGGLTRLTESGLSITEWRPVAGSLPPTTTEAWESEFAKYRDSPEFQLLNPRMTLDEFKQIYWMEWGHRLWGRVIGVTILLPSIYFIARAKVSARMAVRLVGISGLIGFQGFLGWWMVKSGLKDDLFAAGSHPRVSQYRLTAHLGTAFLVYSSMLLSGLQILRERRLVLNPESSTAKLKRLQWPPVRRFNLLAGLLVALVFTTAMSGGLVAGLDAGLIYNEFPYMGLGFTPPKSELFDPFYSHTPDRSDLWWRNMLENPSLVQLDHRVLAVTTFTAVMSLLAFTRFYKPLKRSLPVEANKAMAGVAGLVTLQATLGISTLVYLVPTWLASLHQAGSLALLTGALVLYTRTSVPRRTLKVLRGARRIRNLRPPGEDLLKSYSRAGLFSRSR